MWDANDSTRKIVCNVENLILFKKYVSGWCKNRIVDTDTCNFFIGTPTIIETLRHGKELISTMFNRNLYAIHFTVSRYQLTICSEHPTNNIKRKNLLYLFFA